MKIGLKDYRLQFIIDNDLVDLEEVSEEKQRELQSKYRNISAMGEEAFFREHKVLYDQSKKKFYKKVPLELTREEIEEYALLKNIYLQGEINKKLNTIKNILVFFFILVSVIVALLILG